MLFKSVIACTIIIYRYTTHGNHSMGYRKKTARCNGDISKRVELIEERNRDTPHNIDRVNNNIQ